MSKANLLKGFKKPKNIVLETEKQDEKHGEFEAGPFEKGLGVTIANSLRRTLLSSIQGYAITAIKVDYFDGDKKLMLTNEYENISGVKEDTIDIISKLKKVDLMIVDESESRVISIEKKGPCKLTAADFEVDNNVKVLNPDLHIATLDDSASIIADIQVQYGRGYMPSEKVTEDLIETIGTIPIDAIFSPIKQVSFDVKKTRVGQRGDYDKINLVVDTNGSIKADDAIAEAAKILKEHYSCFINFKDEPEFDQTEYDEEEEKLKKILTTPVEELELSVRSSNCLKMANIKTIGDLVQKSEDDMVKTKNFGKKSLAEIQNKLKNYGLSLGMKEISLKQMKTQIVTN